MVDDATGAITDGLRAALADCFAKLSADGKVLTMDEQLKWLVAVNKKEGRGSEWRAAAKAREAKGSDALELGEFVGVYAEEVAQGKFWGVEHDLRVLRGDGLAVAGAAPFTAVFDYVFASDSLEVVGAQPPLDEARGAAMLANGETWLPNEWYASDHLPVAAALRFREGPA